MTELFCLRVNLKQKESVIDVLPDLAQNLALAPQSLLSSFFPQDLTNCPSQWLHKSGTGSN